MKATTEPEAQEPPDRPARQVISRQSMLEAEAARAQAAEDEARRTGAPPDMYEVYARILWEAMAHVRR